MALYCFEDQPVTLQDFKEVAPRLEYVVTKLGLSLAESMRPMCEWRRRHFKKLGGKIEPLKAA